jgi:methyltransferase (TIGR00027 family)
MSEPPSGKVQITADALIHLRTSSPLARRLGIECPYDPLFLTAAGAELAKMALSLDPVYEQFNLVRYAWFARRMSEQAGRFAQMVILGAGYDTRSLALAPLRAGACCVFELDYPDLLVAKRKVLSDNGVDLPDGLRFVGCDLNGDNPGLYLEAAGFDPAQPSAAFMEGAFFFLRGDRAAALLDPAAVGLARGSTLTFDAWTATRARRLNEKLMQKTGRRLFGDAPLGDSSEEAAAALRRRGYSDVAVTPLDEITRQYGVEAIADPMQNSWLAIDARVA